MKFDLFYFYYWFLLVFKFSPKKYRLGLTFFIAGTVTLALLLEDSESKWN